MLGLPAFSGVQHVDGHSSFSTAVQQIPRKAKTRDNSNEMLTQTTSFAKKSIYLTPGATAAGKVPSTTSRFKEGGISRYGNNLGPNMFNQMGAQELK